MHNFEFQTTLARVIAAADSGAICTVNASGSASDRCTSWLRRIVGASIASNPVPGMISTSTLAREPGNAHAGRLANETVMLRGGPIGTCLTSGRCAGIEPKGK